jgi:hypothetical protein
VLVRVIRLMLISSTWNRAGTKAAPVRPLKRCRQAHGSGQITGDLLGVNELHEGRSRSLMQVTGLSWSYEVNPGRQGCCTYLLYRHRSS